MPYSCCLVVFYLQFIRVQKTIVQIMQIMKRNLQQTIPKEVFLWCNIVTAVRRGQPSNEILAYAKEHEIDLICMGASGTGFSLDKLFGSTVDRVLRRAPCPVLVSRPLKSAAKSIKAA